MDKKKANLEKGKDLFFQYNGSIMSLDREGLGTEYRNCNIPKEIESQWKTEIRIGLQEEIKDYNGEKKVTAILKLMQISDFPDRLNFLITILNDIELDSFSRIIICESLVNEKKNIDNPVIKKIIDENVDSNKLKLLNDTITIDESYKNASYMKKYDFSIENLKKRIKDM